MKAAQHNEARTRLQFHLIWNIFLPFFNIIIRGVVVVVAFVVTLLLVFGAFIDFRKFLAGLFHGHTASLHVCVSVRKFVRMCGWFV